jgi:hypothetical protein
MSQVFVYTVNLTGKTGPSFLTLRSSGYCAAAQNQRKTAQTRGKTVDYPPVSRRWRIVIFTGGTATGQ